MICHAVSKINESVNDGLAVPSSSHARGTITHATLCSKKGSGSKDIAQQVTLCEEHGAKPHTTSLLKQ